MLINPISTTQTKDTNNIPKMRFIPHQPAVAEDTTAGYAPVTQSLWGKGGVSVPFLNPDGIDFGAARPTNNPKGFDPIEADTQSGFRLSTLPHAVICPDCGRPIMTKPIFAQIKSELDQVDESQYLKVIEGHKEILLPQELDIIDVIKQRKSEHPEMSLQEIVAHEREERFTKLEREQYKVMDKIDAVAEVLPYSDRSKITGLIKMSSDLIFRRENTYAFQRSKFIELVEQLKISDPKAKQAIRDLAEELPSSMANEDAWFVKYGGLNQKKKVPYSSREIAEKIVAPSYTNTDHVHPWNRGGFDAVSNFWLMHARCNIIKTDKPFMEWLNEDKENRIEYIGQHLRDVQAAIDASDDPKMHPKYDLYAAKLAKTIYYESNGEVDFTEEFPLPEGYDVPRPANNEKKTA